MLKSEPQIVFTGLDRLSLIDPGKYDYLGGGVFNAPLDFAPGFQTIDGTVLKKGFVMFSYPDPDCFQERLVTVKRKFITEMLHCVEEDRKSLEEERERLQKQVESQYRKEQESGVRASEYYKHYDPLADMDPELLKMLQDAVLMDTEDNNDDYHDHLIEI